MMSVQEQINADIKDAMKAKNVDKLAALRAVKSAIMLEATKEGIPEVSDEISLKLIAKLVKQRKDSAQIYNDQNRADLEKDELAQLRHLEHYLPKQLSEQEVNEILDEIIVEQGADSMKDMGRVMSIATEKLSGLADGKLIAALVRNKLQ